jgi:hypothetical protein
MGEIKSALPRRAICEERRAVTFYSGLEGKFRGLTLDYDGAAMTATMSMDEMVAVLRRVAAERQVQTEAAIQAGEWRDALDTQMTSLIWRTIAVALKLEIVPAGFKPDADPIDLARELRQFCEREIKLLSPTDDKADPRHKIQTIAEVLDGILYVVAALEMGAGRDPEGAFFLANAAMGLGRAESELGLAEDDHWATLAALLAKQPKPPKGRAGYRPPWEVAFEAKAIEIAQGKPVKRAEMIRAARAWNEQYRKTNGVGLGLPDGDKGIGDGIDRLAKRGAIKLEHL